MSPSRGKPLESLLRRLAVLAAAAICSAAPAYAEEESAESPAQSSAPSFEVTPFIGYRMGGSFDVAGTTRDADVDNHGSFGVALDLRIDEGSQYELLYSRQQTRLQQDSPLGPLDLDVEYLHLGGTLVVDQEQWRFTPYVAGGLGLTRFSPKVGTADDDTRFSLSLGAGVRVPISRNFGLRFEVRGYVTLIDTDTAFFCASGESGGFCAIRARGSTFVQYELLAGAAFAF